MLNVANNQDVKKELYQSYLIKPAKKFFSLGLLSDGEDNNNGNGNNGNNGES